MLYRKVYSFYRGLLMGPFTAGNFFQSNIFSHSNVNAGDSLQCIGLRFHL